MLENWVQKHDAFIKEIYDKLLFFDKNGAISKDNNKVNAIEEKLSNLEEELRISKNFKTKKTKIGSTVKTSVKCDQCRKM